MVLNVGRLSIALCQHSRGRYLGVFGGGSIEGGQEGELRRV